MHLELPGLSHLCHSPELHLLELGQHSSKVLYRHYPILCRQLLPQKVGNQPHLQGVITYIFGGDGVDLHPIVQQGYAALPIYPHSSYVFISMPMSKGVWIQEGSLLWWLYTMGTSIERFFGLLPFARGVQAPFLNTVPSLSFNCAFSLKVFMSRQLWIKCSRLLQW